MSNLVELMRQFVSEEGLKTIDEWVAKYPDDQKKSAVMQTLMIVQEANGYLTEASMDAVADYLSMPRIAVYEVASFYSMYQHAPTGRHHIKVCTSISCKLRNSQAITTALSDKLKVSLGETTTDGRFTLSTVECLGACVNAPMMQINKQYHECLTVENLDDVLEQYL